jgi:hypothetical protein
MSSLYKSDATTEPVRITTYGRRLGKRQFMPKPAQPIRVDNGPTYEQLIARANPRTSARLQQRS